MTAKASNSKGNSSLRSDSDSRREAYATGCTLPSCSYAKTPPTPLAEPSVYAMKGLAKSGHASTGAVQSFSFSVS
jgi:hypothetical protein